jgi:hypothetical protein
MNKPTYKAKRPPMGDKRNGHWPRMETWQTIAEGFQNVKTSKILTKEEFELHRINSKDELLGFIIKS